MSRGVFPTPPAGVDLIRRCETDCNGYPRKGLFPGPKGSGHYFFSAAQDSCGKSGREAGDADIDTPQETGTGGAGEESSVLRAGRSPDRPCVGRGSLLPSDSAAHHLGADPAGTHRIPLTDGSPLSPFRTFSSCRLTPPSKKDKKPASPLLGTPAIEGFLIALPGQSGFISSCSFPRRESEGLS